MYVSTYTAERVGEFHRRDLRRMAERERLARQVSGQPVRGGREQRQRMSVRRPLGVLLIRLGTHLTGADAGQPVPAPWHGVSG